MYFQISGIKIVILNYIMIIITPNNFQSILLSSSCHLSGADRSPGRKRSKGPLEKFTVDDVCVSKVRGRLGGQVVRITC